VLHLILSKDDQWNSEFKKFGEQLAIHNLYIKDVAGDGNCLFRYISFRTQSYPLSAISDQMDGTPERYDKYRQECVNFIESNRFDFEPFIEDDIPFDVYCLKMRKNATWGGNIEIQALSRHLGVNICIHQADLPRWEVNNWAKGARQIHLSYHSGEHYASVRPLGSYAGIPQGIEIKPPTQQQIQSKSQPPEREEKLIMVF
jgi:OTU domain-containing protein 3